MQFCKQDEPKKGGEGKKGKVRSARDLSGQAIVVFVGGRKRKGRKGGEWKEEEREGEGEKEEEKEKCTVDGFCKGRGI